MGVKKQIHRFYGRRKSRSLSPSRKALMAALLPQFSLPNNKPLNIKNIFKVPIEDVWMEIGFGAGENLIYQAVKYPRVGFLGVEPFVNGVANLLTELEEKKLENIRIFDDDVRLLVDYLPPNTLGKIFVLFSDPWPKSKHKKRRLVSHLFLSQVYRSMKYGSKIIFASDDMSYVRHVLSVVSSRNDFVWRPNGPDDWKVRPTEAISTRYESKARDRGRKIVYLQLERR